MEIYKISRKNINNSFGNKRYVPSSKIEVTRIRYFLKDDARPSRDCIMYRVITRNFSRTNIMKSSSSTKS